MGPGGHPTEPEVRMLMEKYPSLSSGDAISYADVESVIGVKRISHRYRTITGAWRKRMYREFNITIGAVPNTGFIVLDAHERVNLASNHMRSGVRRIRTSGDLAQNTEKSGLNEQELKACDHLVRVKAIMLDAHAHASRQLRVELREIRRPK